MRPITYSLGFFWSGFSAKAPAEVEAAGATPLPFIPIVEAERVSILCILAGMHEVIVPLMSVPGLTLARFGISRERH